MKKLKQWISICLCIAFAMSIVACSGAAANSGSTPPSEPAGSSETAGGRKKL